MSFIIDAWTGKEKLWKVFWIYGILFAIPFAIFGILFFAAGLNFAIILLTIINILYCVWIYVSLWRCAFNSYWVGWGYIVRFLVILAVIAYVAQIGLNFSGYETQRLPQRPEL